VSDADVAAFRRSERERCRALRRAEGPASRAAVLANVDRVVDALLQAMPNARIAFYWPIQGEVDLLASMERALDNGALVALPVVVAHDAPLVFRQWTKSVAMERGIWYIPVPCADAKQVDPDAIFVPVVGYDPHGYRLGNGGGFYDRTLAVRAPRPLAIGIGFTSLVLPSLRPEPHDIPMDVVVTEGPLDEARLRARIRSR
jgi:5,10-methenyltetrahydrofolate synthetase